MLLWRSTIIVLEDYYDLREKGGSGDVESLKLVEDKIWGLIEKDPDFFDLYILLYDVLKRGRYTAS